MDRRRCLPHGGAVASNDRGQLHMVTCDCQGMPQLASGLQIAAEMPESTQGEHKIGPMSLTKNSPVRFQAIGLGEKRHLTTLGVVQNDRAMAKVPASVSD